MNKVILLGNLTRDPEIRYSQGENALAIARFSIAVNRRFSRQGDTDTDFFNCTAFGRQAEFVEKYFHKGSRMLLSGRVQNDANAAAQGGNFGGGAPQPNAAANDDFMNIPDGIEDGLPFN